MAFTFQTQSIENRKTLKIGRLPILSFASCMALIIASLTITTPVEANADSSNGQSSNNAVGLDEFVVQAQSPWITLNETSENTKVLLKEIKASALHGLNPSAYGASRLENAISDFTSNSVKDGANISKSNLQDRQKLDSLLNEAFHKYISHLGQGVLDAQRTQRDLYRPAPSIDTHSLLTKLNNNEVSMRNILANIAPRTQAYTKLTEYMNALLLERDSGFQRTKVRQTDNLQLGASHPALIDIRARLVETGDLAEKSKSGLSFDSEVENAIKKVQAQNGLAETGKLTDKTILALNATVEEDIAAIALSLERWRWMPRDLGERNIQINIPDYRLTMQNGDQRIVDMAVVVGSKKHPTPVFSKGARFVEVAPTWTVPASITNNELIPLELKKPGYLERERFDFFRWNSGKLSKMPRSQITESDFNKKPFPYVLRQRSGKGNALGKLKILMPNEHAIYLHDTPAKSLFANTDRAYSHGCIRLSDPFRLGSLLLQLDGKSPQETDKLLKNEKTTRIKLQTTTPTHISYFTAWIDDDGKLQKRKDVYQHNKSLISGLISNNTLLSTLKTPPASVLAKQGET